MVYKPIYTPLGVNAQWIHIHNLFKWILNATKEWQSETIIYFDDSSV